jgi:hypothetical protein
MLAMLVGCVPPAAAAVAVALSPNYGRNHAYVHCAAAAASPAGPNGVVANDADCCEGVGVTEKNEYIDHQTVASIDSRFHCRSYPPHHLHLDNVGSASEDTGVDVEVKTCMIERQGKKSYTSREKVNWCVGMRTLTIPSVARIDPSSNRTKAPPWYIPVSTLPSYLRVVVAQNNRKSQ